MADEEPKTQTEIDMLNTIQERLFYWLEGEDNGVIINQLLRSKDLAHPLIEMILETAGFHGMQARVIQLENMATPDVRGELEAEKENNAHLQELIDELQTDRNSLQNQIDAFLASSKTIKNFNSRTPEKLAEQFHTVYEKLAPQFGHATNVDTRQPWEDVPINNQNLMIAVAGEVLNADE